MGTKTAIDLRRFEREAADVPVSLVLAPEKFQTDDHASAIDVSLTGMGVRTSLELMPGDWVGIVPKGEFPHAIPTKVVWVREEESSRWKIAGLNFLQTLES